MNLMNFIKIYILLILTIVTAGCSDDFLDIPPETLISGENFWRTEKDAVSAVTGCYDILQPDSYFGFDRFVLGDVRSDNCFAGGDNADNFAIDNFTIRPTNGVITRHFKQVYRGIARVNTAITRIGLMEASLFSDGRKEALLGEVHFLRALHYFDLVRLFGAVPLVLEETTVIDPEVNAVPRNPEEQIYNQIIEDLNTAILNLEEVYESANEVPVGRVSAGAARGLLAKVHLTLKQYDQVIQVSQPLLTAGYRLLSDFESLFNQENKNNPEVLFAVRYNGGEEGNVFPELVLPTPEAQFDFLKFNTPTPNSIEKFIGEDTRAATSFVNRNGNNYVFKWRNGTAFNSSDYNVVLRYADVLLMRAEALNLSGQTGDAIELLNQIRNRAGLADYNGGTDQSSVDGAIFEERRIELMYEGQRWFDLKRRGYDFAQTTINIAKPDVSFAEFEMLLPLPQEELDKNPLLTQNPGY